MSLKSLFLSAIVFLLVCVSYAQQGNLQVSKQYEDLVTTTYKGNEYVFSKLDEYLKNAESIKRTDIDSVIRSATVEFAGIEFASDSLIANVFIGKTNPATTENPKLQALMNEIQSVIKKHNPRKGLDQLKNQLGKINKKATETLSETEVNLVHATSATVLGSFEYWSENSEKWKNALEAAKSKKAD
jgi:hypothetical protein